MTDPTISLTGPGGTVAATGPSGATVTYTVNVSDAVDSAPTVTCSKNSGTTFAIGTTQSPAPPRMMRATSRPRLGSI